MGAEVIGVLIGLGFVVLLYWVFQTGRSIGRKEENHRCRMAVWNAQGEAFAAKDQSAWRRLTALGRVIFNGRESPIKEES